MGYQTPNIDWIAREGVRFTDWYKNPAFRKRFGPVSFNLDEVMRKLSETQCSGK